MKGLPKSIIKKYGITKKAWSVFRGRKKSKSKGSNPKTKTKKKVYKKMTKNKTRRSGGMTVPMAVVLPLAAPLIKAATTLMAYPDRPMNALNPLSISFTGYDLVGGSWNLAHAHGLKGLVIGLLIHKFVGGAPLNLNKILSRAKVPFIRI